MRRIRCAANYFAAAAFLAGAFLAGALAAAGALAGAFTSFATVLAMTSLYLGYRGHRAYHAWLLVTPGLLLIWGALLYPPLHHSIVPHAVAMTLGGVLIAIAHLVNLRLSFGHSH